MHGIALQIQATCVSRLYEGLYTRTLLLPVGNYQPRTRRKFCFFISPNKQKIGQLQLKYGRVVVIATYFNLTYFVKR